MKITDGFCVNMCTCDGGGVGGLMMGGWLKGKKNLKVLVSHYFHNVSNSQVK